MTAKRKKPDTVGDFLEKIPRKFEEAGISTPMLDAELVIAAPLSLERFDLYLNRDRRLTDAEVNLIEKFVQRRLKREPIAYILGYKEFWSQKIKLTPEVLIPRPETEGIVEAALLFFKDGPINILDLCTGSGAVATALAEEMPQARILATDITDNIIRIAKQNLAKYGPRVSCKVSNLFDDIDDKFDLITVNPPYGSQKEFDLLEPEIRLFEPRTAILAGLDGLAISKKIIKTAPSYLKPKGALIMEIGMGQSDKLRKYAHELNRYSISIRKDYAGIDRIMVLRLTD